MFKEIHNLLFYYNQRRDLQEAFPEVKDGKLSSLITWASYASQNLHNDKDAYNFFKSDAEFYFQARKYENFLPDPDWKTIPKLFFIFGAGRSGTTLMKRILNSHSMIAVTEEAISYDNIVCPLCLKYERIFESKKKWLGLKSLIMTDCLLDENFISFPLANHDESIAPKFRKLYQNQPIIFIIRDVRDRVSSMYNFIKKTSPDPKATTETYVSWIEKNPFIKENFHNELTKIKNLKNKLLVLLSLEWKIKNSALFEYKKRGYPILEIKYEDLVVDNKKALTKITSFLDLPFDESMLDFINKPHPGLRDANIDRNYDEVRRKTDIKSIGLYKKYLDSEQIDEIISVSGDMMKSLGYNFSS